MKTGTVKWFNALKGYGFLKPGDGGFNIYVHISAVERAGMVDLKVGQTINFEMVMDDRTGEVRAENLSAVPELFENPRVGLEHLAPIDALIAGCLKMTLFQSTSAGFAGRPSSATRPPMR